MDTTYSMAYSYTIRMHLDLLKEGSQIFLCQNVNEKPHVENRSTKLSTLLLELSLLYYS
jgi:hypothetical protein